MSQKPEPSSDIKKNQRKVVTAFLVLGIVFSLGTQSYQNSISSCITKKAIVLRRFSQILILL